MVRTEWSFFPLSLLKLSVMIIFLRSVGMVIVYPFFGLCRLSTKKVCLISSETKRVLLRTFLYFFGLKRLTLQKNTPLESSFEFLDFQNYENTDDHSIIWARKINESVLYQAIFSLFFKLSQK